jgi:TnpA family transposase
MAGDSLLTRQRYTEINFAAFAMLGKRFCPRIRSMHKQRIYRIDKNRDYGCLEPLVSPSDRTINLRLIRDHWERMTESNSLSVYHDSNLLSTLCSKYRRWAANDRFGIG